MTCRGMCVNESSTETEIEKIYSRAIGVMRSASYLSTSCLLSTLPVDDLGIWENKSATGPLNHKY